MKQFKASELQVIPYKDEGEPLVSYKGVWVRQQVKDKLERIPHLVVVEGYRSPKRQERYFLEEFIKKMELGLSLDELIERTHKFVALPSVAGHPTGGAVDVTLEGLDMGGLIADFSKPELMPTFSEYVNEEQRKNRKLLHDLMVKEGFAPFYGEWWHFSYGDKEWAATYRKPYAIYAPLNF